MRREFSARRDFTGRAFVFTLVVVVMTIVISKLFVFDLGELQTKKTSILSEVFPIDAMEKGLTQRLLADTNMLVYEQDFVNINTSRNLPDDIITTRWSIANNGRTIDKQPRESSMSPLVSSHSTTAVRIEDYSLDNSAMGRFYSALADLSKNRDRALRIAVMGDSFIESDILTSDLREMLQERFGGRGVGFIPFSDAFVDYRATINKSSSGWDTYNIVKNREGAAAPVGSYYVSGMVCVPQDGAITRIRGAGAHKNLDKYSEAKLLFVNKQNTSLTVCINDTIAKTFTPPASPNVQQIVIHGEIKSIDLKVNNVAGFLGYGVVLEDSCGVRVDNYSVRGNSGLALARTDYSVNSQLGRILDYDLIVLQYGLNAMSADVTDYRSYVDRMERIVDYIKRCFPESSILVMSVGDRSSKEQGELTTMSAVRGMVEAQRRFAKDTKVAFWNTYEAMGGENSMIEFVRRNWASKDYVHINLKGGKYIATQLVNSIFREHQQTQSVAAEDSFRFQSEALSEVLAK